MKKKMWKKRIFSLVSVFVLIGAILTYTRFTIKAEINEVEVTVSKVDIPPRTEITEDMVETITIPLKGVPTAAYRHKDDIIGKYPVSGYGISKNSFIYQDKVVTKDQLPDVGILKLKDDEVAFPLLVDLETSLGNSILPDTYVDLYFKSEIKDTNTTKAIYGKLASQVRVVAVKDADASNVFDNEGIRVEEQTNTQKQSLAKIYIFALPDELNEIVNKAKIIGNIVPIATANSYVKNSDSDVEMNETDILEYIESFSYDVKENKDEEKGMEE